jgi:hypothetical protein
VIGDAGGSSAADAIRHALADVVCGDYDGDQLNQVGSDVLRDYPSVGCHDAKNQPAEGNPEFLAIEDVHLFPFLAKILSGSFEFNVQRVTFFLFTSFDLQATLESVGYLCPCG